MKITELTPAAFILAMTLAAVSWIVAGSRAYDSEAPSPTPYPARASSNWALSSVEAALASSQMRPKTRSSPCIDSSPAWMALSPARRLPTYSATSRFNCSGPLESDHP